MLSIYEITCLAIAKNEGLSRDVLGSRVAEIVGSNTFSKHSAFLTIDGLVGQKMLLNSNGSYAITDLGRQMLSTGYKTLESSMNTIRSYAFGY